MIVQPATNVAIVTFSNTDGKCSDNRIKFNKDDNAVYSFILSAHMADKNVEFRFNTIHCVIKMMAPFAFTVSGRFPEFF